MKPLVTLFYLQPLFDVLARSNPPQVVLPFDASATPKEISAHIRDAITRISMRVCKKKKNTTPISFYFAWVNLFRLFYFVQPFNCSDMYPY